MSSNKIQAQAPEMPEELLSLRRYAGWRHRQKLPGGSMSVVQLAIQAGKIHRRCGKHDQCPPDCGRGKIPRDRADAEWAQFHDAPAAPRSEMSDARTAREVWKSRLARIEYEEKVGALVRADKVRAEQFRWARAIRDSVLGVSRRVAGRVAAETRPRVVQQILDEELELALSQVPGPEGAKR